MKQSLRRAICLFNLTEQLIIFAGLVCFKLRIKKPAYSEKLLAQCNHFVRLIEEGVHFQRINARLCKAGILLNQKHFSVFLRKHSSDLLVFESVMQSGEYRIAAQQLSGADSTQKKIIIDAGGNIGLTCIYLFAFYPHAQFFVIEPDEKNFELLEMNLKENSITSAVLFKKALWTSDEKLVLDNSFRDGKEWSVSVKKKDDKTENTNYSIEGITLQQICASHSISGIDLLKIDIEGAERFLFTDTAFLQAVDEHVSNLIIEIHDEFNIRDSINQEMNKLGYKPKQEGDVTLFTTEFRNHLHV